MLVGRPEEFAIESHISLAYNQPGLRALGFFTLLIKERCFGIREDDATMLANSLDEVCLRIADRGRHVAPFSDDAGPQEIATAIIGVLYCELPGEMRSLGMTNSELCELIHTNRLVWAPDGDEAFDDRSFVRHFDVGSQVRLVAFRRADEELIDTGSLVDQWLPIDEFYGVLGEWRDRFLREWEIHPKEQEVT